MVAALLPAVAAGFLRRTDVLELGTAEGEWGLGMAAWGIFSLLLGLLLLLRALEAYHRFWSGASATHRMRAEWLESTYFLCACARHSRREPEAVGVFKHLLVRLISVLHATALLELKGPSNGGVDLEVLDGRGINQTAWTTLRRSPQKAELVFQWIHSLCIESAESGVLSAQSPILSSALQKLSDGMLQFKEAKKVAEVPVPFQLMHVVDVLLIIHWLAAPVVTSEQSGHAGWAAFLAFLQVFLLWALERLAVQLQDPFHHSAMDLDMVSLHRSLNHSLLILLDPDAQEAPRLSKEALLKRELLAAGEHLSFRSLMKEMKAAQAHADERQNKEECWEISFPAEPQDAEGESALDRTAEAPSIPPETPTIGQFLAAIGAGSPGPPGFGADSPFPEVNVGMPTSPPPAKLSIGSAAGGIREHMSISCSESLPDASAQPLRVVPPVKAQALPQVPPQPRPAFPKAVQLPSLPAIQKPKASTLPPPMGAAGAALKAKSAAAPPSDK
eukprot:TRINITY_DN64150_c0_g1_i1.p1 TRINITY_DN64150_c0_g1~~TRINITY_DN64150_c0_g1_i1.p1  ORF type:complete len:553 (+),score=114.76 TRINITY_DN64150_c0_g1_i1:155-1660(+)